MAELGWKSVGVARAHGAAQHRANRLAARRWRRPTSFSSTAATRPTSTAGCASPGWRSSSRRSTSCTWGSVPGAWSCRQPSRTSSRPGPALSGGWAGRRRLRVFPHLDNPDLPENTMADAERWAAGLTGSGYAIDDETAIKVVDGGRGRDLASALAAARDESAGLAGRSSSHSRYDDRRGPSPTTCRPVDRLAERSGVRDARSAARRCVVPRAAPIRTVTADSGPRSRASAIDPFELAAARDVAERVGSPRARLMPSCASRPGPTERRLRRSARRPPACSDGRRVGERPDGRGLGHAAIARAGVAHRRRRTSTRCPRPRADDVSGATLQPLARPGERLGRRMPTGAGQRPFA